MPTPPVARPVARCPRCRSTTLTITEISEAYQRFSQQDGRIDPHGYLNSGPVVGVYCQCARCSHTWKPRGARQIIDFAGYP